ncbi:MAG TPA: hypothetical protein VFA04_07545 [Bryobacteraceae bacterium]|nr:hypothetical protein [Bryobacteraceae bacterium]
MPKTRAAALPNVVFAAQVNSIAALECFRFLDYAILRSSFKEVVMPFPYSDIPTVNTWKEDSKLWFDASRDKEAPTKRIDDLLTEYAAAGDAQSRKAILCYIVNATRYWMKNAGVRSDKLSARTGRMEALCALRDVAKRKLAQAMNLPDTFNVDNAVLYELGTDMYDRQSTLATDLKLAAAGALAWLDGTELRTRKLCFRSGMAYRCSDATAHGAAKTLTLFDTTGNKENPREMRDFALYVMGDNGRIYAGGHLTKFMFNHSSFLQGQRVAAAGEIRCIQGRIDTLSASSGHYHPTMQQMVNVLERLAVYGVDLSGVKVLRKYKKGDDKMTEECAASDVLARRAWPGRRPTDIYFEEP